MASCHNILAIHYIHKTWCINAISDTIFFFNFTTFFQIPLFHISKNQFNWSHFYHSNCDFISFTIFQICMIFLSQRNVNFASVTFLCFDHFFVALFWPNTSPFYLKIGAICHLPHLPLKTHRFHHQWKIKIPSMKDKNKHICIFPKIWSIIII